MKVAELQIICGRHSFGEASQGLIGFDTVEAAKAEFDRLADLTKRREARANDLEDIITVSGITEFSCPLDQITSIALVDFAHLNEQLAGVKDAFPNIFKH